MSLGDVVALTFDDNPVAIDGSILHRGRRLSSEPIASCVAFEGLRSLSPSFFLSTDILCSRVFLLDVPFTVLLYGLGVATCGTFRSAGPAFIVTGRCRCGCALPSSFWSQSTTVAFFSGELRFFASFIGPFCRACAAFFSAFSFALSASCLSLAAFAFWSSIRVFSA